MKKVNISFFIIFILFLSCGFILPAGTCASTTLTRLAGLDRYETAQRIAEYSYPAKAENVVLTTGTGFADALSASVLAHELDAPILLVNSMVENSGAAFEYIANHLETNGNIYLIGEAALNSGFTLRLKQMGYTNIEQISGADRYQTALLIAERCSVETGTSIVIASGENFPDALGISGIAAGKGWPIILTPGNSLPESIKTYIKDIRPSSIYIIGGSGVISESIETEIQSLVAGAKLQRLAGMDRFETAAQVLQTFTPDPQTLYLASGTGFADALAGSVLAAKSGDPIVLIDPAKQTPPKSIAFYLDSLSGSSLVSAGDIPVNDNTVYGSSPGIISLGGTAVVSDQVMNNAANISSGLVEINDPYLIDDLTREVTIGGIFLFPNTVKAQLYDSTISELPVSWEQASLNTGILGTYSFIGKVSGYNKDVVLKVIVKPDFESLKSAVCNKIGAGAANVGVSFYDLTSDISFSLNGSRQFLAASTAKLPIVMVLYDLIKEGRVREDQLVYYHSNDYEGGTGILQYSDLTKPYSFDTLAKNAIIYSDNIAIIMIKHNACPKAELEARLKAKIGHFLNNGENNVLSSDDAMLILKQLYSESAKGNTYYQQIIGWLKNTIFHDRLDRNIDYSIVAHKIGNLGSCTNDIGIFYTNKPYILAVYTTGLANPNNMISSISDIVYNYKTEHDN